MGETLKNSKKKETQERRHNNVDTRRGSVILREVFGLAFCLFPEPSSDPFLFLFRFSLSSLFRFPPPSGEFPACHPLRFFLYLTDNGSPTVRSDNRTEIVTVLVSPEIHPCQMRTGCIQLAMCFFICLFASHAGRRVAT